MIRYVFRFAMVFVFPRKRSAQPDVMETTKTPTQKHKNQVGHSLNMMTPHLQIEASTMLCIDPDEHVMNLQENMRWSFRF